jgi:probable rRNA maturation factor
MMILIDADLELKPNAAPARAASMTERALKIDSAPTDRNLRVPSARSLGVYLRKAQAAVRLRGQVSLLLTTDEAIRRLNRQFRGKNKATDVLSFPAGEAVAGQVAGDLAISVQTARRQARDEKHALAIEIKVLILHGLLHLAGFDHETDGGEMARRERLLRRRLGLPLGLIERAGKPNVQKKTGPLQKSALPWVSKTGKTGAGKAGRPGVRKVAP